MTHVFHRHTHSNLPIAISGDGAYIVDQTGKTYLDASGGAAVSCLGHSHPEVIRAIKDQLDAIPFAHTAFFTNEPLEQLAAHLATRAPDPLDKVYVVSGGSEAMEAALKMGRQYFLERDEPSKRLYIARRQSYHGNTLGALATGGNLWRRQPYDPLLMQAHHIAPCYAYREQRTDETAKTYALRAADELEEKILELGAENVIGFVAEPVVGATLGAVPPEPGYFRRIREICDRHGILLILDEVMCGMGRTGTLFACEQDGICGDLIAIAKGLGGGYQPVGAVMVNEQIYQTIHQGTGFFQHGHTYLGHAVACAAALAVQRVIEHENLLERVQTMGALLMESLVAEFGEHPHVGDIRGRGLFVGLEFVADKSTKSPFEPSLEVHRRLKSAAMDNGLICYPMGGTVDGRQGSHVLLAPPYTVSENQLSDIVDRLATSLDTTLKTLD